MGDDQKPELEGAYALQTPEDSIRLYADWAETYDFDFAESSDYLLPKRVAEHFLNHDGRGPVLDIGAGTGLLAQELRPDFVGDIDATDISQEMLDIAAGKGLYRRLFAADLTVGLPCEDGAYEGVVSSGTFTHGHVGPETLDELVRITQHGGLIAISINAEHFEALGFAAKIDALAPHFERIELPRVAIYGSGNSGTHKDDLAIIALLRKR